MHSLKNIVGCITNSLFAHESTFQSESADIVLEHMKQFPGYVVERHTVTTEDGWKLVLHRVQHLQYRQSTVAKTPVLVLHGMLECSYAWLLSEGSLGMMLATAGCDVWLANNRGNSFSEYVGKESIAPEWTFEDMGIYDVPAMTSHICSESGSPNLTVVGQSQGAVQTLVCCSVGPQEARKSINRVILLAPPVVTKRLNLGSAVSTLAASIVPPVLKAAVSARTTGPAWLTTVLGEIGLRSLGLVCSASNISTSMLYFSKCTPSGCPALCFKQLKHWMQILGSGCSIGRLAADSKAVNLYPLGTIGADFPLTVDMFFGHSDAIVDIESTLSVVDASLPLGVLKQVKVIPGFSHVDVVLGKNRKFDLYPHVLASCCRDNLFQSIPMPPSKTKTMEFTNDVGYESDNTITSVGDDCDEW